MSRSIMCALVISFFLGLMIGSMITSSFWGHKENQPIGFALYYYNDNTSSWDRARYKDLNNHSNYYLFGFPNSMKKGEKQ